MDKSLTAEKHLSPLAVANWFLAGASERGQGATAMRLQRLTYFAHCWCLALCLRPLTDEYVCAYPYGPVFRGIYEAALIYGSKPIREQLFDGFGEGRPPIVSPRDPRIPLLLRVWSVYGNYTDVQLSNLANEKGGPWQITILRSCGRKNPNISEDLIIDAFRAKIEGA